MGCCSELHPSSARVRQDPRQDAGKRPGPPCFQLQMEHWDLLPSPRYPPNPQLRPDPALGSTHRSKAKWTRWLSGWRWRPGSGRRGDSSGPGEGHFLGMHRAKQGKPWLKARQVCPGVQGLTQVSSTALSSCGSSSCFSQSWVPAVSPAAPPSLQQDPGSALPSSGHGGGGVHPAILCPPGPPEDESQRCGAPSHRQDPLP